MNKDLDERLVPNGEYRDALNIEISTSEGSNVGSVQNIKGNKEIKYEYDPDFNVLSDNALTVGSYTDESTKTIFNFIHKASDLIADGVYSGSTRFTGVKSDVISTYTTYSAEKGNLIPLVVDVFESRHATTVPQTSNLVINNINTFEIANTFFPEGVRVGMKVDIVLPNGTSVLPAESDVRVKDVTPSFSSGSASVSITPCPVLMDQALINNGAVYKFTSDKILNFKAGVQEVETNTNNTPTSDTPKNNLITAINYVDGILFYTDGRNEPKRIILDNFKDQIVENIKHHSKFLWNDLDGQAYFEDMKEEHITVIRRNPKLAPKVELKSTKRAVDFVGSNATYPTGPPALGGLEYADTTISTIGDASYGSITAGFRLINFNSSTLEYTNMIPGDELIFRATNPLVNWRVGDTLEITGNINGSTARIKITTADYTSPASVGLFTADILDIDQEYIDVIENLGGTTQDDNLVPSSEPWLGVLIEKEAIYPEDFIYFAYRYVYANNEYSAISPYSTPAFLPGFYSYNAKDSYNKGMENKLQSVVIKDFVELGIGKDVKAIELLFRKSGTENIYVIERIDRALSWGSNYVTGSYTIENTVFGRTLSSDQAVRVFDAVPTRAKAQEISSSRLMYGNYELGYDLKDNSNSFIKPELETKIKATDVNVNVLFPIVNDVQASLDVQDIGAGGPSPTVGSDEFKIQNDFGQSELFTFGLDGTYSEGLGASQPFAQVSIPESNVGSGTGLGRIRGPMRFENETDFNNNFALTDNYGNQCNGNYSDEDANFVADVDGVHDITFDIHEPFLRFQIFHSSGSYYNTQSPNPQNPVRVVGKPTLTLALQIKKVINNKTFFIPDSSLLAEASHTITFEEGNPNLTVGSINNASSVYPSSHNLAGQSMGGGRHQWNLPFAISGGSYGNNLSVNYNGHLDAGDEVQFFVELRLDSFEPTGGDANNTQFNASGTDAIYSMRLELQYAPSNYITPQFLPASSNLTILAPPTFEEVLESRPKPSIKTLKSYQLGVVYGDYYGRETNVMFDSGDKLFCDINQSKTANKLAAKIKSKAPVWADYYKFFVKEIAPEFYNLVMYKAYPNNDTFQTGQTVEDATVYAWLAFNSNDKNKVSINDYLVLKKRHATNESVQDQSARYRIIDIVDNAVIGEDASGNTTFSINNIQIDATINDINGKFFVKIYANEAFNEYIGTGGVENDDNAIMNGAVFEVEKKDVADLDLFYECSQAYPIRLSEKSASNFIKKDTKVQMQVLDTATSLDVAIAEAFNSAEFKLNSCYGAKAFPNILSQANWASTSLSPNYVAGIFIQNDTQQSIFDALGGSSVLPSYYCLKFISEDGSYVTAKVARIVDINATIPEIRLIPYTHAYQNILGTNDGSEICVPWFNCYSFGNGVESDRIRDDFNSDPIWLYTASGKQSGFKVNLPLIEKTIEKYPNEIIFSQIYNESSNTSRYNEFILADPTGSITKKLNSEYGSIQKLYTRQGDLLAFCENKVLQILANKDALFNADGNSQLLSSTNVLGQARPFVGDYGISTNPESFSVEEYRIYFADKFRGAVCRLSRDGITPISDAGMKDFFNDNLQYASALVGSYDGKKGEYNLTIHSSTKPDFKKEVYTISYSEDSKGWVSFKSFIKESGLSLGNEYYTFKNGKLYLHHPDIKQPDQNNFYGTQYTSTITPIFNVESNTVKVFNTVAYSGSQSKEL